jgi:hypothetical protein
VRRLPHITLAVLAAFAVRAAVPRPIVVTHHHAGGEHAHVHGDGVAPHDHHSDHDHHHDHHDEPATGSHGRALELPAPGDHTHWQHPFQRAARVADPGLVRGELVVRLAVATPPRPAAAPAVPSRSRGPPRLARS